MLQHPSAARRGAARRSSSGTTSRSYGPAARRFVVIAAIAWWLGGFTFYAGVAVPVGMQVLGSHKAVGFITQRVTGWLNVGGVIALLILLANLLIGRRGLGRSVRWGLLLTWILMAVIEVELIAMHPVMDRLLVLHPTRMILDEERFDTLHRVYLISSSVQWAVGLAHVWFVCMAWLPAGPIDSAGKPAATEPASAAQDLR